MHKNDPLIKNPDSSKELFDRFSQMANGFSADDVVNASVNLVINALRQSHAKREQAELSWDELMARTKTLLMECYDSTGRTKGIFPYPQTIIVPHMDFRPKNGT